MPFTRGLEHRLKGGIMGWWRIAFYGVRDGIDEETLAFFWHMIPMIYRHEADPCSLITRQNGYLSKQLRHVTAATGLTDPRRKMNELS